MTQQVTDKRTFSNELKKLIVRKAGHPCLFIRKVGSIQTHCVYLFDNGKETPILDRVKGVGGVGDDQVQDMEAVSEEEHKRCINAVQRRAKEHKEAIERKAIEGEALGVETDTEEGEEEAQTPKTASDLDGLTVKKLLALIVLEDLDVDTKGASKPILIERIKAARAGVPDPTQEPVTV